MIKERGTLTFFGLPTFGQVPVVDKRGVPLRASYLQK